MKIIILVLVGALFVPAYGAIQYEQKANPVKGNKKVEVVNDFLDRLQIGMDFALRFQALEHENDSSVQSIRPLSPGFSNANGNTSLYFDLGKGASTYIEAYLSSEHHEEMWMREGYLFIDSLEMLGMPFVDRAMSYLSFKAGQMEINYGDYHFRRTDNGQSVRNPFIGNYIIDANTTEIGVEAMLNYRKLEFLLGFTGGTTTGDTNEGHGIGKYAKLAFDEGASSPSRFRISGTVYQVDHSDNPRDRATPGSTRNVLYSGNRSGSPYKDLFNVDTDAGQILPNTSQDLFAYVINVLWQRNNSEIFLNYDYVEDKDSDGSATSATLKESWEQYAVDYKYNFSPSFYGALRYNVARHLKAADVGSDEWVSRYQAAVGYFLNPAILMKLEYVYQRYHNFNDVLKDGKFSGIILEGAVSF